MDYKIAGHRIRIAGSSEWMECVKELEGFVPFEVEEEGTPVATMMDSCMMPPECEQLLYETKTEQVSNRFGRMAGGYIFETTHENGDRLTLWKADDADIVRFQGALNKQLVRFALWIAYGLVTVPLKTVAIHTSVIVNSEKAVIFLGESGTGKSTHTRLWREYIEGSFLLNDDSPVVRIEAGVPMVYGSPWSGKTPCYKTEHYPLAACVRLSQAPYNRISRLKVLQAYAALHPSCPPDFAYDEQLYDCISAFLSDLLAAVPVYHLACKPDEEAARTSYQAVFES